MNYIIHWDSPVLCNKGMQGSSLLEFAAAVAGRGGGDDDDGGG